MINQRRGCDVRQNKIPKRYTNPQTLALCSAESDSSIVSVLVCLCCSLFCTAYILSRKHISIQFIDFRRSSNTDGLFTDFREILKHGFLKFEWSINLKSIPKNLAKTLRASVIVKFSPRTSSTCGSCSILFATRSNAFKIIALWSKPMYPYRQIVPRLGQDNLNIATR